ncbi:MAG: oligosaccharide flippase family protein, partial [Pseudomonadota bacterium]
MWIVCGGLVLIQLLVGLGTALLLGRPEIGWMVVALSGVYLIMPFGLVQAYILQRHERMKRLSLVFASQSVADHMLTAALALCGFGAWAIVLPKLLTAPIWLVGVRYGHPWRRDVTAGTVSVPSILTFSMPVLLSEVSVAAREQLDKLLVSLMFGLEILGLYYFAFNAGLGLSTALNRAFNGALYPFLCRSAIIGEGLRRTFKSNLSTTGLALIVIYFVQAAAALVYVPIIFGDDWAFAAPVVALLCLTGPARLLADSVRIYWRAAGDSPRELRASFIFALSLLLAIPVAAPWGLTAVVVSMIVVATIGAALLVARAIGPQRT